MTAMTVSDIYTRVQRSFGDEAGIQVTEADVIRWINDAQREAVMQHEGLLVTETKTTTVAGQSEYSLPSTCFTVLHVYFRNGSTSDTDYYALSFKPASELNYTDPGWVGNDSGYPVYFTKLENNSKIRVYPAPDGAYSDGLKIVHTRYPTKVNTSSDAIDLPEYYHSYVEHFCMMKAYEKDEDWAASDRKAQLIQSTLNENLYRESWFGRETYPVIVDRDE